MTAGVCRKCGCTDERPCLDGDGLPCLWVEPGLCSTCVIDTDVSFDDSDVTAHGPELRAEELAAALDNLDELEVALRELASEGFVWDETSGLLVPFALQRDLDVDDVDDGEEAADGDPFGLDGAIHDDALIAYGQQLLQRQREQLASHAREGEQLRQREPREPWRRGRGAALTSVAKPRPLGTSIRLSRSTLKRAVDVDADVVDVPIAGRGRR